MTAPLNIVFYCSLRFYRIFFAGPSADYDYIIVLSIYFVSLYASKSMVYELILFLMVNTR